MSKKKFKVYYDYVNDIASIGAEPIADKLGKPLSTVKAYISAGKPIDNNHFFVPIADDVFENMLIDAITDMNKYITIWR